MENHSICDTVAPSSLTEGCLHRVKPPKTMADLSSFGLDVVDELSSAIEESFGIANCEGDERKQGLYILFGFGCVQFLYWAILVSSILWVYIVVHLGH